MIDIGTGDGAFVYQSARSNPRKFYIGIDASPRPLEKVSEKIHRRPAKGGLPNAIFVQASAEDLPSELDGLVGELYVYFPWGSLLRSVATGDAAVLGNLRRICRAGATLEVVLSIDPLRDRSEIQRLELSRVSLEFINSVLVPKYRDAGFEIAAACEMPPAEWSRLRTSWAKRLNSGASRRVWRFTAQAQ